MIHNSNQNNCQCDKHYWLKSLKKHIYCATILVISSLIIFSILYYMVDNQNKQLLNIIRLYFDKNSPYYISGLATIAVLMLGVAISMFFLAFLRCIYHLFLLSISHHSEIRVTRKNKKK